MANYNNYGSFKFEIMENGKEVTSQIPTVHLRALKQRIMKEDDMEKGLDWLIN